MLKYLLLEFRWIFVLLFELAVIIVAVLGFINGFRLLRILIENLLISLQVRLLNKEQYKILRRVFVGEVLINYLIVSPSGVHVIKKCQFKRRKTFLSGEESEKLWNYYESYTDNASVTRARTTTNAQAAFIRNAEMFVCYNPIMEVEKAIKELGKVFSSEYYQVPFYPVVVLVPRIQGVSIARTRNSEAKIVFSHGLLRTIRARNVDVIPNSELNVVLSQLTGTASYRKAV